MLTSRQFLKKAVELGRIPHALLFYGQDTPEKMSTALEFVKMVNGPGALNDVRPDLAIVEPEEDKDGKDKKDKFRLENELFQQIC